MHWRKRVGQILMGLAALITIAVVAGYFYLRSNGFREFAIREIVKQADEATGGHAQISSLDFEISTLTAHLYGIVLRGSGPSDSPPLLQVDKLTVGLKIVSVLQRKVSLSELLIEHPSIRVQVDRQGHSNLPQPPATPSSGNTNIFDLAIGHFRLTRGELYYNDQKAPLTADLRDLAAKVDFDPVATRYHGSIAYDTGHLQYGAYSSLPHAFNANFSATRSGFILKSAFLKVASSTATVDAQVTDYHSPVVTADYSIDLRPSDLQATVPAVSASGRVSLEGRLQYRYLLHQPFLRSIVVDGNLSSDALSATSHDGRLELRRLQGLYRLADGALQIKGVEADSMGGHIVLAGDIRGLDTTPASRIRARLQNISLHALQQASRKYAIRRVAIAGAISGSAVASWSGSLRNIQLQSDLVLHSSQVSSGQGREIPIDGAVHAIYEGKRNLLILKQTTLRIPSTTLTADGQVSERSSLRVQAVSRDIHQLAELITAFRPAAAAPPAVSGSATLNATVQGSLKQPEITAQVRAADLRLQGSAWKSASLSLRAAPSRVVVSDGLLIAEKRGQASFGASVELRNWSYSPSDPIRAKLTVQRMPVVELERLANVKYPVSGELSVNASLSGSQLDPKGSGSVEIASARVYDEPMQSLAARFDAGNGSVASVLSIVSRAGSAKATMTYAPKNKAYRIHVDAPAIVLQKLHAVQSRNLMLVGTLAISASGEGTLDDPQLTASLHLPGLEVRQKLIKGVGGEIRVAKHQADLSLDAQVADSSVRARGHVNLAGDYDMSASIDTATVPLEVLLATFTNRVPQDFQGQFEFHLALKGPLKDKARLEGHLTIPILKANYQKLEIGAAGPIRADYSRSVLTLQPTEVRGTGTSLHLQGVLPLAGGTSPTLTAQGSIDARIFRLVSPEVRSSGNVILDIRASRTEGRPTVEGQVQLQNIAFATPDAPLGVDKLNGTLAVGRDRVQITGLTANVGSGQITASGSITYQPEVQFDIAMQGSSVRLRYPEGLRTILDTNLAWTGNLQTSTISGRVLVSALSFTPEFDLATIGDQFGSNAVTPAQPGFADTMNLQLAVQSKDNLSATSSQVSLEGSADLRVIGTAANPVLTGRMDMTSGELFYRNVRYELQRGIIGFDDPSQTRPVLNVSVTTKVEQYDLTLNLRGAFDQLTTTYTSDPPLATADIINLIARGKTSSELAASSQSTDSMIASQAASQVSGSIQKLAGLSSLQLEPTIGANSQNPSSRVAIQQRVTKNFLFTFSTDVSQPGSEVVQGDYQINKRWSVSVARDQLGGVSVDGRFHTKF